MYFSKELLEGKSLSIMQIEKWQSRGGRWMIVNQKGEKVGGDSDVHKARNMALDFDNSNRPDQHIAVPDIEEIIIVMQASPAGGPNE